MSSRSVTIVGVHFAPETTGNAPYTTAMATALARRGWRVRVVTGLPHYPGWSLMDERYREGSRWVETTAEGVEVIRVRHHIPPRPDLLGRARMEATFFLHALRALRMDRSDVLVAISPTLGGVAAAVASSRRRPLGILVQDLTGNAIGQSGTASGVIGSLVSRAEYALYRRARRIGVITPRFGDVLSRNGMAAGDLAALPNFTHIAAVAADRGEARRRLGWPDDRILVVHTGNMGRKQGLETVVEAARLAESVGDPTTFVLVGDGNQREVLRSAGSACSNLLFVDPLDAADYPYALAAADVLLVNERPGVQEMSLPSKVTSYVVAGRPVVAAVEPAGITGTFLRQHGVAVCSPAGDAPGLLRAVTEATSPERARALVRSAHDLHDRLYSRAAAEARYAGFVEELSDGAPATETQAPGRLTRRPLKVPA